MDYKKIIRSPAARQRILGLLRFVPDVPMLKLQYRIKTGRSLELKKPRRFTEKLQWYKLYYHNPLLHLCADKYAVRTYVERKGLGELLVRLYARYDNVDQVDWRDLPQRFVIKTTNGGGGLNVIVCPDKAALNLDEAQEKLRCEKSKPRDGGREWAYYGLEPGIIVEELLENKEDPDETRPCQGVRGAFSRPPKSPCRCASRPGKLVHRRRRRNGRRPSSHQL